MSTTDINSTTTTSTSNTSTSTIDINSLEGLPPCVVSEIVKNLSHAELFSLLQAGSVATFDYVRSNFYVPLPIHKSKLVISENKYERIELYLGSALIIDPPLKPIEWKKIYNAIISKTDGWLGLDLGQGYIKYVSNPPALQICMYSEELTTLVIDAPIDDSLMSTLEDMIKFCENWS